MRHIFGNCLIAGGFCLSVNDTMCEGLHSAYDKGIRAGLTLAKHMRGRYEWKPAKEPPKESGEYIVLIHKAANPTALLYNAEIKSWFEVTIEDGEEVSTYYPVDYWMPLPEPPEVEK